MEGWELAGVREVDISCPLTAPWAADTLPFLLPSPIRAAPTGAPCVCASCDDSPDRTPSAAAGASRCKPRAADTDDGRAARIIPSTGLSAGDEHA